MLDEWKDSALCASVDPDIFFPDKGENARQAKRICAVCPVLEQCRHYALTNDVIGVWGGMSDRDRAAARRSALRTGRRLTG